MKILLIAINAKYIHANLAVHYLKAYCEKYGEQIQIREFTINQLRDDILKEIYKEKPDVAAFSCYIWNIAMVDEVSRELKKVLPGAPIYLGGPEVSYNPCEQLKKKPWITGVMAGEGETAFRSLAESYIEGTISLREIKGLYYRQGKEAAGGGTGEALPLDKIPFPYTDFTKFENKLIYYESARGCPYSCSYCLSSVEKGLRLRSLQLVKQELLQFIRAEVPLVKFVDRTFNANREHAMAIWRFIHEQDRGKTSFHFEISADLLREEEIALLRKFRPGLAQFEIGVQSVNPAAIEAIRRNMDLKKLTWAVAEIRKGKNIHQHLDLIAGLPYEDLASFQKSFDYVYQLKPNQLQLGFLKVLKGAPIYGECEKYEIRCQSVPPFEVLSTKWLSYADILKLKQVEEMVEAYYNSGQFTYSAQFLEAFFPSAYALYEALGNFYEKEGLLGKNHTRLKRYDILREFFIRETDGDAEAFGQILLYDLYLRENLKSRPDFAVSPVLYKEKLHAFYEQEERLRRYLPGYGRYTAKQLSRMTHLEFFTLNPVETAALGKVSGGKTAVLFDYANRDALTFAAGTTLIQEEE